MPQPFKTVVLNEQVQIDFFDRSNRYFGNFHRVLIDVVARCQQHHEAEVLEYRTRLSQMAVPGEQLAAVRTALIQSFMTNRSSYLKKPDFFYAAQRTAGQRRSIFCC